MLDVNEFKAELIRRGFTQAKLALAIGMKPRTLSNRLKKRIFGSDEIEKICRVLNINSLEQKDRIFFASRVT